MNLDKNSGVIENILHNTNSMRIVHCRERDIDNIAYKARAEEGAVVRILRGYRCYDMEHFFQEWGAALQFPYYFDGGRGANWSAFDDCIQDLSWLPAKRYMLILTAVDQLLSHEDKKAFSILLEILNDAAKKWTTGWSNIGPQGYHNVPVEFSIIFHIEEGAVIPSILEAIAEDKGIPTYNLSPLDDIH